MRAPAAAIHALVIQSSSPSLLIHTRKWKHDLSMQERSNHQPANFLVETEFQTGKAPAPSRRLRSTSLSIFNAIIEVIPHPPLSFPAPFFANIKTSNKKSMAWALVTPASRGVGFHLTRLLLQTTNLPIIATARKDAQGVRQRILEDLSDIDSDRLTVLELDVTSTSPFPNSQKSNFN